LDVQDVMRGTFVIAAAFAIAWNVPFQGWARLAEQSVVAAPSSGQAASSPQGEKGLELLSQGQYKDAISDLQEAIQLAPDSSKYALGYAEALLSAHYKFTALEFLEGVNPRFHNLPEYRYTLGLAYYLCFRYSDATKVFQTIPQDDPKFSRVSFLIGNCYMATGDLRQAETNFRRAIELKPGEAEYYVRLGKMLRMQGPERLDEAIAVLKKAWDLDPHDAYAGLHLAYCQEERGEYPEAQTVLEQAVQVQPGLQPARLALANAYEHNHEETKARQQREIAARLKPPPNPVFPR
jgi:tetratricopeptide (TPR) repeat protein